MKKLIIFLSVVCVAFGCEKQKYIAPKDTMTIMVADSVLKPSAPHSYQYSLQVNTNNGKDTIDIGFKCCIDTIFSDYTFAIKDTARKGFYQMKADYYWGITIFAHNDMDVHFVKTYNLGQYTDSLKADTTFSLKAGGTYFIEKKK